MRAHCTSAALCTIAAAIVGTDANPASADDCDETCQKLRAAQDPLADVRAIMTDNTFAFGTTKDKTSYNFQVQPVYTLSPSDDYNVILRGIIPITGVFDGAYLPWLGSTPVGGGYTWGLSDVMLQTFFVPKTDAAIKFGFGPQLSLPTHTDSILMGPGWGGGAAIVAFGFAGDLSYGGIVGHHWGQNGFSLTTVQPIAMYNLELFGGSYIGYNNSVSYDWKGKQWTVPLGLTFGKTLLFESGHAVDMSVGAYGIAAGPSAGADWQLKVGLNMFFP